MTDCNCICATFGNLDGSPHDADARHPKVRVCRHEEEVRPPEPIDVPYPTWRDESGDTYFSVGDER